MEIGICKSVNVLRIHIPAWYTVEHTLRVWTPWKDGQKDEPYQLWQQIRCSLSLWYIPAEDRPSEGHHMPALREEGHRSSDTNVSSCIIFLRRQDTSLLRLGVLQRPRGRLDGRGVQARPATWPTYTSAVTDPVYHLQGRPLAAPHQHEHHQGVVEAGRCRARDVLRPGGRSVFARASGSPPLAGVWGAEVKTGDSRD